MKIEIEEQAVQWYKREMGLGDGDSIRVFVRLGGCGSVQPGFSLGIAREERSATAALSQSAFGLTFFIEPEQLWYFDGRDLQIRYDEAADEAVLQVAQGAADDL
ncbi:HesB/YadR/YfhF family protein [Paenibacillus sp. IB182496]|uniref:HesB/YadR/YfhF family protein n=1 Tax=Paenibacillus sabuli TaxID=2772509 RepID=A0A927GTK3_9BACL|nr:HesB/YadR/YfhF family protein [Paenibacillus sabuli]MBD2847919.1 HesB/YadR/YfhF family protein [Paenibacillus sabuli]